MDMLALNAFEQDSDQEAKDKLLKDKQAKQLNLKQEQERQKYILDRKQYELIEEIKQEANDYIHLMHRYHSIPFKEDGREAYLVHIDWLEKWKIYV